VERIAPGAARPDPAEVATRLARAARAGPALALATVAALAALASGCGGGDRTTAPIGSTALPPHDPTAIPLSVGPGARYRPRSLSRTAAAGRPIEGLRCARRGRVRFGVHVELFANRRVVIVPAGIGIAPPRREAGAYVKGGRCSYPLRTREPTGVVEIEGGRRLTLGDLFAVWGQPLSRRRVASFGADGGAVEAYVGGRPWRGDPRAIPLRRHAQIVLEVGGHVPPHARYRFPSGL
jgi:hypothetical protein